MAAPLGK